MATFDASGHPVGCRGWAERWKLFHRLSQATTDARTWANLEAMKARECAVCKGDWLAAQLVQLAEQLVTESIGLEVYSKSVYDLLAEAGWPSSELEPLKELQNKRAVVRKLICDLDTLNPEACDFVGRVSRLLD